jgi:hypothetical protein
MAFIPEFFGWGCGLVMAGWVAGMIVNYVFTMANYAGRA